MEYHLFLVVVSLSWLACILFSGEMLLLLGRIFEEFEETTQKKEGLLSSEPEEPV